MYLVYLPQVSQFGLPASYGEALEIDFHPTYGTLFLTYFYEPLEAEWEAEPMFEDDLIILGLLTEG